VDEDGVEGVRLERWVEVCEALLRDEEVDSESGESEEEESEGYGESGKGKGREGVRRSTRGNPVQEDTNMRGMEELGSDLEEAESSDDGNKVLSPPTRGKGKGKANGKGKRGKKDRDRVLSREELRGAEDTFELFFEESTQLSSNSRTIGLPELKNITRLLKEKFTEAEVSPVPSLA
jgi:hypothetical protein